MSIFKDKVYEEMDDISKLIEPYQYSLNDELSQFPDEVVLDSSHITSFYSISIQDIVRAKAKELELNDLVAKVWDIGDSFFEFKMLDNFGEVTDSVEYNFQEKTINGKIVLIKKKPCLEDNDVVSAIKRSIENVLHNWGSDFDSKRINEIADLFNSNTVSKQRSVRKKMRELRNHIVSQVDSRKLDIRDVGLATRFAEWIVLYVKYGNLPALANITKLKIMTHQNRPIYSIDEKATV
jgi:hypothetical protein